MHRPRLDFTLTSTARQSVAPLAVGLAGRFHGSLQDVSGVADEAHHVVQVELGSLGHTEGGVTGVTACDGWERDRTSG